MRLAFGHRKVTRVGFRPDDDDRAWWEEAWEHDDFRTYVRTFSGHFLALAALEDYNKSPIFKIRRLEPARDSSP